MEVCEELWTGSWMVGLMGSTLFALSLAGAGLSARNVSGSRNVAVCGSVGKMAYWYRLADSGGHAGRKNRRATSKEDGSMALVGMERMDATE